MLSKKSLGNSKASYKLSDLSNFSTTQRDDEDRTRKNIQSQLNLTLYYGTDTDCLASIVYPGNKFKPSSNGCLGPGVYFTEDKEKAFAIAQLRSEQRGDTGAYVIVCRVKTDKKCLLTRLHEQWPGVCGSFTEYCLVEGFENIEILRVEQQQANPPSFIGNKQWQIEFIYTDSKRSQVDFKYNKINILPPKKDIQHPKTKTSKLQKPSFAVMIVQKNTTQNPQSSKKQSKTRSKEIDEIISLILRCYKLQDKPQYYDLYDEIMLSIE